MQEKKIKFTDVLFVGLAFFASYFGAGNLIFPPMLGLQSGSNWLSGMIGMLASGVGLPILAIIVLGMCGSVQKISDHVNKKFYTVMIGAIMILCCCVSIPRTAAVGIEMGASGHLARRALSGFRHSLLRDRVPVRQGPRHRTG
ncbi:MAG: branched-chain amino acid transport system II carrier protein [Dysosmobacter sp.]